MKKFLFYLSILSFIFFFPSYSTAYALDNFSNLPTKIVNPECWKNGEILHLISESSDVKLYSVSDVKNKYLSSKVIIKIGNNVKSFDWECLNSNFTMPVIYELGTNKNGDRLIGVKIYNSSSAIFPKQSFHILIVSNGKIVDAPIDNLNIAKKLENILDLTYDENSNTLILSCEFQKLIFSGNEFMHAGQSVKLCPINNIVEFSVESQKLFIHFTIPITSYKKCAVEFIAKASLQIDFLNNYDLINLHIAPCTQVFSPT